MMPPVTLDPLRTALRAGRLPRLLPPAQAATLADHGAFFGPTPQPGHDLIAEVERSGLRGRGGAGFPTARKMSAVARGRRSIVVVNATEGEPTSGKDKTLVWMAPHLVLDGAVLAAKAVGAREVIVCIDRAASKVIKVVEAAIAERKVAGWDTVPIRVAGSPSRYVAGEESALVHWLNGGDAKPTVVPPRPFERGVAGRPTLVDNAETLAHVALIARFGSDWFRTVGTETDTGTALVTVSGGVLGRGVYEIPFGVALGDVLDHAGAARSDVQAVLVGGYFGTWIAAHQIPGIRLESASLLQAGASFGCGALAILTTATCGLVEAARVTRWLADQNAGQCGPCVFGLPAISAGMDALVGGDRDGQALASIGRWLGMVKGRGACKHPDGAARFVDSSLLVFAAEIDAHRRGGCSFPPGAPVLPTPGPGGWR
jgi:NADH:ubiquinone oxidoreductase subunit F (NADH-binding)